MEIRTTPRPLCLVCGSEGKTLYPDLQDRMFAVPGTWSLKQCNNPSCGLCWLDPMPVEEDLPTFYVNYFTHEISDPKQRLLFRLRTGLYTGYLFVKSVPSVFLGLNSARNHIQHMFLQDKKPGKLLDVGCGSGVFLHRMYKLGWSATGLDFDAKAIENAKIKYGTDLTVMHSDLHGAKFPNDSFDAVTMSHVIEHAPDPIGLITECKRVLKPGGRLVITTPNINSNGHKRFRDCWWGLDSPRHLQIFSLSALRDCAIKAGFQSATSSTSAANADTFIGGSFGFAEAKRTGDHSSGSRVKINFVRGLRSLLLQYREAIQLRHNPECGEELVLICEK
jgi:ubiquinone/menaquinone biosynthesis C-methylase UbiE